ncbi:right-handed parallel beta-helix repeat-containing protein [Sphingomonas parva]|uniref:Right-handed parallel beta-helix repeat-containing protein n=1 Tax=Sphingomonas parva TaxID=2555898 RepID=A0A4Y8ZR26_9SPHN|nr:right-handed parallel beta-helix repeat-containing protein [Sphingomonas parva]TFI57917.1 right-handed parallel beta-helix repeat-containing protein [Sphingomonas parva]
MKTGMKLASVATAAVAAFAFAAPAHAQATRTWVSGVGDDVNPCSRTAPCKTFAGAISKTAAGGEINCLDPGGYGTLTITKSITVDCTGTMGSTLNSGGINGFVINDSLSATPGQSEVRLRGLSINGAGTTPGLNGIRFISGKSLVVEDVFIQNQKGGFGISIAPSANSATVAVINSSVVTSGPSGGTGGGMEVKPTGSGTARVSLDNVRFANNAGSSLRVDTTATTGAAGVTVSVVRSEFSSSGQGIALVSTAAAVPQAVVMVVDSTIFNNTNFGIIANIGNSRVRVATTAITGNGTGVNPLAGAFINNLGGNILDGNTTNGAFN